ncbi:transposase [Accumulibacter sp.]|uniref:transposase n=1 Tax=Accumulibacter sp. TaxID=2053492 RepID=UPI0025E5D0DA|nr:transposase [Accumulibacter sp.]MCM8624884.1 transposase [Accumulibacter sp.]
MVLLRPARSGNTYSSSTPGWILTRTLTTHLTNILNRVEAWKCDARAEAMNRALKEARARAARGYRRVENFRDMACLFAGKLTHVPLS